MSSLSRRSLLLGSVTLSALPKPVFEHPYLFATNEYEIRMTLEFYDHYTGDGLWFQEGSSDRHFCLSPKGEENRNCVSNFKGSMAVARYNILSRVRSKSSPSLREYVRSIDQSESVTVRPPFERVLDTQHG